MEWEKLEELVEWARNNFIDSEENKSKPYGHGNEYWYGYNEALSCIACNLYPKEYFSYLMKSWSEVK